MPPQIGSSISNIYSDETELHSLRYQLIIIRIQKQPEVAFCAILIFGFVLLKDCFLFCIDLSRRGDTVLVFVDSPD